MHEHKIYESSRRDEGNLRRDILFGTYRIANVLRLDNVGARTFLSLRKDRYAGIKLIMSVTDKEMLVARILHATKMEYTASLMGKLMLSTEAGGINELIYPWVSWCNFILCYEH